VARRKKTSRTTKAKKKTRRRVRPRSPRRTRRSTTTKRRNTQRGVANAIRLMRRQRVSLAKAARTAGVNPRTVRRLAGSALHKDPRGRYVVRRRDRVVRVVYIPTADGIQEVSLKGSDQASVVGDYWNAVHAHVAKGESAGLGRFEGVTLTSTDGTRFVLLTDLTVLDRLANAGVLSFESIYART